MNVEIIGKICDVIIENKDNLTELDRVIGDGDHGVNLSRGASKIKENLDKFKDMNPSDVMTQMAMILMSNVGGASGALYASALLKAGMFLKGKDNITNDVVSKTFLEMINGIKSRGKSDVNEKTMLDTLEPAFLAFDKDVGEEKDLSICFKDASVAAKKGMESTKDMVATKGRAAYLGERSVGHIDAGATSSYLIIKTIADNM